MSDEDLEKQEVFTKVLFDGYFFKFDGLELNTQITILDDNPCRKTILYPPLSEKDGVVDLTMFLHTFLQEIINNPGKDVRAYITGFGRKMYFDKDMLSKPLPEELLNLFRKKND